MTPTPTEASQEVEAVARVINECGSTEESPAYPEEWLLWVDEAKAAIVALDSHRAKHGVVPNYLQEIPPEIADDVERTVRSVARTQNVPTGLFRFKDKDSTND